jgi:hypothetical protein
MAGGLTNGESDRLVNCSLGITAYTAPTGAMKLALASTASSASAAGTEVTGGSYARQAITFGTPASGGTGVASTAATTFTNMPTITTTHGDIYDSNGSPRRAYWAPLGSSKSTNLGDTLTFPIGSITVDLD